MKCTLPENEERNKEDTNIEEEKDSNNPLFLLWYKEIKDKVKGNWNQWKDKNFEGKKINKNMQIEI